MQYYKPWELREDEEEQIKRQIEDVDATIRQELAKHAPTSIADTEMAEVHSPVSKDLTPSTEPRVQIQNQNEDVELVGADDKKSDTDKQGDPDMVTTGTDDMILTSDTVKHDNLSPIPDHKPQDENGGEELVEGQEDDVIY